MLERAVTQPTASRCNSSNSNGAEVIYWKNTDELMWERDTLMDLFLQASRDSQRWNSKYGRLKEEPMTQTEVYASEMHYRRQVS